MKSANASPAFSKQWQGATSEKSQAQTFWLRFYECFGIRAESATIYEQAVKKLNGAMGYIDSFISGKLIVEHKSAGKKLEAAFDQASEYFVGLKEHERPRFIIVSDFKRFVLHDLLKKVTHACTLRDRALIGLMVYTFARVGAAIGMRIEDVYVQGRRTWVRLHEKGGKEHEMPCHHNLDEYLHAYIDQAPLGGDKKGFLFRSAKGRSGVLSDNPMSQADVYRMIGRRAAAAAVATKIGCHSFRATGITEYLRNGGKLEIAQQMANHESSRTTGLYDRRQDQVSLDEVERILI